MKGRAVLDFFFDFINSFTNVISSITVMDLIDILLMSFLIYKLWKLVKETRATQLIKGIILLAVAYFVVDALGLKTLTFILSNTFSIGLFALLVIFQPELRRALEKVGRTKMKTLNIFSAIEDEDITSRWEKTINIIVDSCEDLSAATTGALIVIERQTKLGEQIATGTILNATPSRELFGNIFYNKTPLHDGAVVIRDGMILAAACFLPKPEKEELINKKLGSRHRAAIGMSENSDSIIIIVSEETGTISVAENGELTRGFTRDSLKKLLKSRIIPEKTSPEKEKSSLLRRSKNK